MRNIEEQQQNKFIHSQQQMITDNFQWHDCDLLLKIEIPVKSIEFSFCLSNFLSNLDRTVTVLVYLFRKANTIGYVARNVYQVYKWFSSVHVILSIYLWKIYFQPQHFEYFRKISILAASFGFCVMLYLKIDILLLLFVDLWKSRNVQNIMTSVIESK